MSADVEPVVAWFVAGTVLVFIPMLVVGLAILSRQVTQDRSFAERLRFRRLDRQDWVWAFVALVVIGVATLSIQWTLGFLTGDLSSQPAFMHFEPLARERYWILGVWLPFWLLNIAAEEFLWRGVLLPRQEIAFGGSAWLANAAGWLVFHSAFGWRVVAVLVPIALILPYVVQRRKNATLGLLLHAVLNGPAFVAVAFGYV